MLLTILSIGGGVLGGVILALKVIAPRTSTTVDDKILEYAAKLEALLKMLPGGSEALATVQAESAIKVSTDPVTGVVTRDHRV